VPLLNDRAAGHDHDLCPRPGMFKTAGGVNKTVKKTFIFGFFAMYFFDEFLMDQFSTL
jgi:hypothetical protein